MEIKMEKKIDEIDFQKGWTSSSNCSRYKF